MLRKAVAKLMGLHWPDLLDAVQALMKSELSGDEKRQLVLLQLRVMGTDAATWLLSAAVEVAYGELKERNDAV